MRDTHLLRDAVGWGIALWLIGYVLQYATPVPADPAALPVQPGTVAAFAGWNGYLQLMQVTSVEKLPPGGIVVHLRIFGEAKTAAHFGGIRHNVLC